MSIYVKISDVQADFGAISKDTRNDFFDSMYFNIDSLLEQLQPILHKHGLVLTQPILGDTIATTIVDRDDSTSRVTSSMQLPKLENPQKLGSAITYYRRYSLVSLLALRSGDDDDGHAAAYQVIENQEELTKFYRDAKRLRNELGAEHLDNMRIEMKAQGLLDPAGMPLKSFSDLQVIAGRGLIESYDRVVESYDANGES